MILDRITGLTRFIEILNLSIKEIVDIIR